MNKSTGTSAYRERVSQPGAWQLEYGLPDGHRVFSLRDTSLGLRWAIADESGATPPETDDGVLYLDIDPDRPLHIGYEQFYEAIVRPTCSIPLLTLDGQLTRTPTDAASILILAAKYNWPVKVQWNGFPSGERKYEVKGIMQ